MNRSRGALTPNCATLYKYIQLVHTWFAMKFEWDEAKNQANVAKHGVSFEQAQEIFDGIVWTSVDDRVDYGASIMERFASSL